jgi:hypothetical protein
MSTQDPQVVVIMSCFIMPAMGVLDDGIIVCRRLRAQLSNVRGP